MTARPRVAIAAAALVAAALLASPAGAQEIRGQNRDQDLPVELSAEDRARLADPLFTLVLRDEPSTNRLSRVEELLGVSPDKRQIFVVSERIHEAGVPNAQPRIVVAYQGQGRNGVELAGALFLSIFIDPRVEELPDESDIEALAADPASGAINYYKLESGGEAQRSWRFRGSSPGADALPAAKRGGTCFACHVNGAPIMKELALPWNNWSSPRNPVAGLDGEARWPIAKDGTRFRSAIQSAERLQGSVQALTRSANAARFKELRGEPGASGRVTLADARRVLRPLFETTEANLVSARQVSGLHPFDNPTGQPGEPVCPPPDFFLNVDLLGSANNAKGLNRVEARRFLGPRNDCKDAPGASVNAFAVTPREYRELLERAGQRLTGSPSAAPLPQDAHFAWFTPGPSFLDTHRVGLLIQDGAVTPHFAAAVLAVEVERPIFSPARAGLLAFLPQSYGYLPQPDAADPFAAAHPDDLTRSVIAALEAAAPAAGTPEADFLDLLKAPDPIALLGQRIAAYRDRVKGRLEDQAQRAGELDRLFNELRARRTRLRQDEILRALAEFDGLLPE